MSGEGGGEGNLTRPNRHEIALNHSDCNGAPSPCGNYKEYNKVMDNNVY